MFKIGDRVKINHGALIFGTPQNLSLGGKIFKVISSNNDVEIIRIDLSENFNQAKFTWAISFRDCKNIKNKNHPLTDIFK